MWVRGHFVFKWPLLRSQNKQRVKTYRIRLQKSRKYFITEDYNCYVITVMLCHGRRWHDKETPMFNHRGMPLWFNVIWHRKTHYSLFMTWCNNMSKTVSKERKVKDRNNLTILYHRSQSLIDGGDLYRAITYMYICIPKTSWYHPIWQVVNLWFYRKQLKSLNGTFFLQELCSTKLHKMFMFRNFINVLTSLIEVTN